MYACVWGVYALIRAAIDTDESDVFQFPYVLYVGFTLYSALDDLYASLWYGGLIFSLINAMYTHKKVYRMLCKIFLS